LKLDFPALPEGKENKTCVRIQRNPSTGTSGLRKLPLDIPHRNAGQSLPFVTHFVKVASS
jgi:hypothetical protein